MAKSSAVRDDGYYYDIEKDLESYPDCWVYIVFGGRNTGKTYSTLRRAIENNHKFVFVKRTKADIKLLCAGGRKSVMDLGLNVDFSPFVSLNRDFGWRLKPIMVNDDIAAVCHCDSKGKPIPEYEPVGYISALSCVSKYKGFDLSYCDWIIMDEFVPKIYDRNMRAEGDAILDMYKTVGRDREHRGKDCLKLICLANADNAASPLTNTLEVTDQIVEMSLKKEATLYIEERAILLKRLLDNKTFKEKERESKIYKAMAGTKWAAMSLDNDFGYNDFSQIRKINMRYAKPQASFKINQRDYFLYYRETDSTYLLTTKRYNAKGLPVFDLNKESDRILFFDSWILELQMCAAEKRVEFESYTLTRLVYEYKNFFK